MHVEMQIGYSVSAVDTEYVTVLDILNKGPEVWTYLWFYICLNDHSEKVKGLSNTISKTFNICLPEEFQTVSSFITIMPHYYSIGIFHSIPRKWTCNGKLGMQQQI